MVSLAVVCALVVAAVSTATAAAADSAAAVGAVAGAGTTPTGADSAAGLAPQTGSQFGALLWIAVGLVAVVIGFAATRQRPGSAPTAADATELPRVV